MAWLTNERLHLSPVHKRMQMNVDRVEPGLAILSMPLGEDLRGLFDGSIHGGMLATFADAASASCLEGAYDFDTHFPVTTDIHVRYYRQPKGGPLVAEAKLVHGGRRLLSTDCSVVDANDRVLIRTTATFMLVPNTGPHSAGRSGPSAGR